MSYTAIAGKTVVRCDSCGRISSNDLGAYKRPGNRIGYINQKFDPDDGKDFCDECAEKVAEKHPTPQPGASYE